MDLVRSTAMGVWKENTVTVTTAGANMGMDYLAIINTTTVDTSGEGASLEMEHKRTSYQDPGHNKTKHQEQEQDMTAKLRTRLKTTILPLNEETSQGHVFQLQNHKENVQITKLQCKGSNYKKDNKKTQKEQK
eukprot:TRINITY_DN27693_c0_g1_i1.p1 TRINITY_DN27693_c0_g1~~TRINITY_DN27693_c0_g1_i1.p1  ORF type:complete len:133 (-),score=22.05 TRINITY_DN27693_c0_g1_i1:77-475(-)